MSVIGDAVTNGSDDKRLARRLNIRRDIFRNEA
jgi:hypothetical protein